VTGVETLKAMAVEPQMQRRWEEQLAGYVASSFRVLKLSNNASNAVQFVSKLVTAATLYFGAKLVIDGSLTVGELVAFNILAGRVSAPVLRLAAIWQDFHQARLSIARLGDILNTPAETTMNPARAALPTIRGEIAFEHVSFRYRIDGAEPNAVGRASNETADALSQATSPNRVAASGCFVAMSRPSWFETHRFAMLLTMTVVGCSAGHVQQAAFRPRHREVRAQRSWASLERDGRCAAASDLAKQGGSVRVFYCNVPAVVVRDASLRDAPQHDGRWLFTGARSASGIPSPSS
jgi:ABC-type multidrug transport system fused ATPase/permease subunit